MRQDSHRRDVVPVVRRYMALLVWCGVVWCGVVWCGMVWCGVVWCGVVWCGVVWCGVVWCGVVWCGVVWCGVVCRRHCNQMALAGMRCIRVMQTGVCVRTRAVCGVLRNRDGAAVIPMYGSLSLGPPLCLLVVSANPFLPPSRPPTHTCICCRNAQITFEARK